MIDIYKIKFEGDLVGQGQRIEPFDVAARDQNHLRDQILQRIQPLMPGDNVDLVFSYNAPDQVLVGIVVVDWYRPAGEFKVIVTEGQMV
jgi:hypothetical protein